MSAQDKLKVTAQSTLSRRSQRAFESWIDPWLFTAVDQRDDYGRDGFVQVVDDAKGAGFAAPLTFAVQLKAHDAAFREAHAEPLETRHLALWTDRQAPPTLVALWSKTDDEFRCRTAREIVDELALHNAEWRSQAEVTTQFRPEHALKEPESRLPRLRSRIADEADRLAGVATFNSERPRVILTDLYNEGLVSTSSNLTLSDGVRLFVGPGWIDGDLDARSFQTARVLAGALLLYEEVWFEYNHTDSALTVLGPDLLIELLYARRIVPFVLPEFIGFRILPNEVRGELTGFVAGNNVHAPLRKHVNRYASILAPGHQSIANEILRHTLLVEGVQSSPIVAQTKRDLARPSIRTMLGLSSHVLEGTEPAWDWPLVNRLAHINTARAVANARRVDVIEYEGGGSRLAAEKWYSEVDFHRLYPTSAAFDAALRANGIPDLGMLVDQIGLPLCVRLSNSEAGRSFRNWFWSIAVNLLGSGADLRTSFAKAVNGVVRDRADAARLASHLKLAYCQKVGSDYLVGVPLGRSTCGLSSRSDRPDELLARQRRNHAARRARLMLELASVSAPGRNERCPCGSGAKFKRCCGSG